MDKVEDLGNYKLLTAKAGNFLIKSKINGNWSTLWQYKITYSCWDVVCKRMKNYFKIVVIFLSQIVKAC